MLGLLPYTGVQGLPLEVAGLHHTVFPILPRDAVYQNVTAHNSHQVIIDHENQTITIRAWFFAAQKDKLAQKQLQFALDYWNKQSGKYSYNVKLDAQKIKYPIQFDLRIPQGFYSDIGFFFTQNDISADKITSLEIIPSSIMPTIEGWSGSQHRIVGYVQPNAIYISEDYADNLWIGIHEIGHILGARHIPESVMSWNLDTMTPKLRRPSVKEILKFPQMNHPEQQFSFLHNLDVIGKCPDNFWEKGSIRKL